jgi:hypothetical protein
MDCALHISDASNWLGRTNIYIVDTPERTFVAISVFGVEYSEWQNAGVTAIACDEFGCAPTLDALYQTYEVVEHPEVLARLGYTLVDSLPTPEEP